MELQCEEVPFARVLTLNCSSAAGPVVAATCSFDGRPPISCELNNEAACLTSIRTLSMRLILVWHYTANIRAKHKFSFQISEFNGGRCLSFSETWME